MRDKSDREKKKRDMVGETKLTARKRKEKITRNNYIPYLIHV